MFSLGVVTVEHATKDRREYCSGSWIAQQATHLGVVCCRQESSISTAMGGMWAWHLRGYPQTNHCGGLCTHMVGRWRQTTSFQRVRLWRVVKLCVVWCLWVLTFVHAIVTPRTLHFTWLLCESDRYSSIHSIVSSSILWECNIMQPLMYSTVSERPSSPCPPIGPAPTSTQLKKVEASSTGEEPPSPCWPLQFVSTLLVSHSSLAVTFTHVTHTHFVSHYHWWRQQWAAETSGVSKHLVGDFQEEKPSVTWCVLTDPVHINQVPSCCFIACFVPEWHVSTLPLLQLKWNQLYHKVDSRIQMSKVRSGVGPL